MGEDEGTQNAPADGDVVEGDKIEGDKIEGGDDQAAAGDDDNDKDQA
jgi:hypothetical protein